MGASRIGNYTPRFLHLQDCEHKFLERQILILRSWHLFHAYLFLTRATRRFNRSRSSCLVSFRNYVSVPRRQSCIRIFASSHPLSTSNRIGRPYRETELIRKAELKKENKRENARTPCNQKTQKVRCKELECGGGRTKNFFCDIKGAIRKRTAKNRKCPSKGIVASLCIVKAR